MRFLAVNLNSLVLSRYFVTADLVEGIRREFPILANEDERVFVADAELERLEGLLEGIPRESFPAAKAAVVARLLRRITGAADVVELAAARLPDESLSAWYAEHGVERVESGGDDAPGRRGVILCCPELENLRIEVLTRGSPLGQRTLSAFCRRYGELAPRFDRIVLSGSLPPGAPARLLPRLVAAGRAGGAFLCVDSSSYRLDAEPLPEILKANRREALLVLGAEGLTPERAVPLLRSLPANRLVLVTFGADGAVARIENAIYRVPRPSVRAVNPVGAGDSMTAVLVALLDTGLASEDVVRAAVDQAGKNVELWEEGGFYPPLDVEDVELERAA